MDHLDAKGDLTAVQPPILLEALTTKDELASPLLPPVFPKGGRGEEESRSLGRLQEKIRNVTAECARLKETMHQPTTSAPSTPEPCTPDCINQNDNQLNVKKRFVLKPQRCKKGRLKKPKKSSYDYGAVQDTLGLHAQATHLEAYSAARMTINNVLTNDTPLGMSPTKDEVKEERDMLHSIATEFEQKIESSTNKVKTLETKSRMLADSLKEE